MSNQVLQIVKRIPKGKVTTYREIAHALGHNGYRSVGQALRGNPHPIKIPCHRVVCSDGSLGGYCGEMNSKKKIKLLKEEGIYFENGKVLDFEKNLKKF